MSYTDNDLHLFAPITDRSLLKGTAYFELHQGGLPTQYACWLEGSLFITMEAFDFFETCFERAVANFDYFSFNKATPAEVDKLSDELAAFLRLIAEETERHSLFSRLTSGYLISNWDSAGTEPLRFAIKDCGKAIQDYVTDTKAKWLHWHPTGA